MNQATLSDDRADVAVLPPVPFAVSLLAGIGLHLLWQPLALFPVAWQGHVAGWPVVVVAALLAIWAVRTMARAGVSANAYKPTSAIVSAGPYAFSRNPMYLSLTLLYCGISLIVNTYWPLVFLPAVLFIVHYAVIIREERYLERKFEDGYRQYRAKARRWM